MSRPNGISDAQFEKHRLCYQLTTLRGMSGTAVLYGNKFVAIHKGSGNKKTELFNHGRLFTVEMV